MFENMLFVNTWSRVLISIGASSDSEHIETYDTKQYEDLMSTSQVSSLLQFVSLNRRNRRLCCCSFVLFYVLFLCFSSHIVLVSVLESLGMFMSCKIRMGVCLFFSMHSNLHVFCFLPPFCAVSLLLFPNLKLSSITLFLCLSICTTWCAGKSFDVLCEVTWEFSG